MSTLVILLLSFAVLWILNRYVLRNYYALSAVGRLALAIMLMFTGAAHFYKTEEMVQMMSEFLPNKVQLGYLTGVLEILGAAGLVFQRTAQQVSIALILFFLVVLPANIIGSIKKVELGGMENGPGYLYFRIPLQLLFIWWTYYFGIRINKNASRKVNGTLSRA